MLLTYKTLGILIVTKAKGVSRMSKHYFYDYKEDLIKKLNKKYAEELSKVYEERREQTQLDDAEEMIRKYFRIVHDEMKDLIAASNGAITYDEGDEIILTLTIHHNFIRFIRTPKAIEVKIGIYNKVEDLVESVIMGYIVPGEKYCKIKKLGKIHEGGNFDENTLSSYMREAFGHLE